MGFVDLNGLESWEGNQGVVVRGALGKGLPRSLKIAGWSGSFLPDDVKTSAEAIVEAGLDWVVDRRPIIQVKPEYGVPTPENPSGIIGWEPKAGPSEKRNGLPTGGYSVAESHVMNVRRDTGQVLGVVGKAWHGPQNDEAFKLIDDLVDDGSAKWLAGNAIDGGKKIWLCAQLGREVMLGGDENERAIPLMFLSNGWDGGTSLTITTSPTRIACLNGLTIPLPNFQRMWRGRHTSGLTDVKRLKVARETLELSIGYFDAWSEEMERLMTKPLSIPEVERAIVTLLPDPKGAEKDGSLTDRQIRAIEKKRHGLLDVYRDTPDLQNLGSTAYRFVNAVADYSDWWQKHDSVAQMIEGAEPSKIKDLAYALVK